MPADPTVPIPTGWRAITDMPDEFRDGRRLLGYGPTPNLAADYCIVRWVRRFSAGHYGGDTEPGWYGEGYDCRLHPLKWQPLPEPPHAE